MVARASARAAMRPSCHQCAESARLCSHEVVWATCMHRYTRATSVDPIAVLTASPTSHSYFSQRMRLHYLDWGNPTAQNMLLLHGMRDHCHNWDWLAQGLCDRFHIVAPDLRGHGDAAWAIGGSYGHIDYVYDVAQLVHQAQVTPTTIVAHSMGGTLACLYAGIYPEHVNKLVILEGVGLFRYWERMQQSTPAQRLRNWVETTRELAGRTPKRYASLEDAFRRMQDTNPHLSPERARHLTVHGSGQNEDGTFSWKFDNYTHSRPPHDFTDDDTIALWQRIECPVLFINARQGYAHRIGQDDTLKYFKHGEQVVIDDAGHWLHHDRFDAVQAAVLAFIQR